MMDAPSYFTSIQERTRRRWEQLEHDPDLAGPWHQLFKQVQSPRHVLSELLQNADDANATDASVTIVDGDFRFTHNGDDFTEEHFASLCRFGYSNKRALHTIGFRGIGFKSTFSLGDEVQLATPTLSVAFNAQRFTEPVWIPRDLAPYLTEVNIRIKDRHRVQQIRSNLKEWFDSPASLPFFRSIRSLTINGQLLQWIEGEQGPVSCSQWMSLSSQPESRFLLIRSSEEDLPQDALDEVRSERMLPSDEETVYPACTVEIVLGMQGRLFVVLPTGVETPLPFAVNAPFIQDPARLKIKDPEISPTNRWLLSRTGHLAAQTMLGWLHNSLLSEADRAAAYSLVPLVNVADRSLDATCGRACQEQFLARVLGNEYLLADGGRVRPRGKCVAVPSALLAIWSNAQVSELFLEHDQSALSRAVDPSHVKRLASHNLVRELAEYSIISVLKQKHPPKTRSWNQLLTLWGFAAAQQSAWYYIKALKIIPVNGQNRLFSSEEVARLGEKRLLQSEDDWQFLSQHLLVMSQNWLRFLADQRQRARGTEDKALTMQLDAAGRILWQAGLNTASGTDALFARAVGGFVDTKSKSLHDHVRLTQLAARLNVNVGQSIVRFPLVTQNGAIVTQDHEVVADLEGDLDLFVSDEWAEDHALHPAYSERFISCTIEQWRDWVRSGRSGLYPFVPISDFDRDLENKAELRSFLHGRGVFNEPDQYPYKTQKFVVVDFDVDEDVWTTWRSLARDDSHFWGRLMERILRQNPTYWSKALYAHIEQVATTSRRQKVWFPQIVAKWIKDMRELTCLPDTRGYLHKPHDILRRTPETESQIDVEPFLSADLDTPVNRPLLQLLGVRDTPTGPDGLLSRLRALSYALTPPVAEVVRWYTRLDQLSSTVSTSQMEQIRRTFLEQKVVLTEQGAWLRANEVYLTADDQDVPGAPLVHPSVRHLSLWAKVGVPDRPTVDAALQWLKGLPTDRNLTPDELRRVRSLLAKYPERIWHETGRWLNLDDGWVKGEKLAYSIAMHSLVPWKHLFPHVKQRTADLQKLSYQLCQTEPFSRLTPLGQCIEERVQPSGHSVVRTMDGPWPQILGAGLSRAIDADSGEQTRLRVLGRRLQETSLHVVNMLEALPYIEGTPAGTPRPLDVLWLDTSLYVISQSPARLAHTVPEEICRAFGRQDMCDAIKLCYDRSPEFIVSYLEENLALEPMAVSASGASDVRYPDPATTSDQEKCEQGQVVSNEASPSPTASSPTEPVESATEDTLESEEENAQNPSVEPPPEPDGHETSEKPRDHVRPSKPAKPLLIERFAHARGFRGDGSDRYVHADGSSIVRGSGRFPWELLARNGDTVRFYFPREATIERQPLELDSDIWELCKRHPEAYALILIRPDGKPGEYTGQDLLHMVDQHTLELLPATYRLVYHTTEER